MHTTLRHSEGSIVAACTVKMRLGSGFLEQLCYNSVGLLIKKWSKAVKSGTFRPFMTFLTSFAVVFGHFRSFAP